LRVDFGQGNDNYDMGKNATTPVLCLIYKGGMQPIKLDSCHPVFRLAAEYKEKLYDELKNKGVKVEENPKNKSHFVFYDIDET
jgi:hypothetical protein